MDNSSQTRQPEEGKTELLSPRPSRPGSVTTLAMGVLIITALNLTRLVLSIRYWSFLSSQPGVQPLYMALTGLIWSLVGILLLWGLWRAKNWAPRLMLAYALTYALYYWLDQVFLVDHPLSGAAGAVRALLPTNWKFAAGATVLCLAYTAWALNRARVKAYFGLDEASAGKTSPDDDNNRDDIF